MSAATLRARTFLRLGDPERAHAALGDLTPSDSRDRSEIALLLSVACSRLGDQARASDALLDAFVFAVSSLDDALEAEVEYYTGLAALTQGDLSVGRDACARGLDVLRVGHAMKNTCIVPHDHIESRLHELLGVLDAADGKYRDQLVHSRAALATLDRSATPDVFQEAFALRNLAILASDLDIVEDARRLTTRASALAWTEDVCRVEFTTFEALAWCSALRGDCVDALQLFRYADRVASTDPERVIIGVDRALIAREYGHTPMLIEEIKHALTIARAFDWEGAMGDTRYALLSLSQAAAVIAPIPAREMLDRYTTIRNSMDSSYAARLEPRARAEEAYTSGLVLRAEGQTSESMERLQGAFEIWNSIGYEWRAARAALELAELDAGDVFRLAVRYELSHRPESIFAARGRLVA